MGLDLRNSKIMKFADLAGRLLFSLIFLTSGLSLFSKPEIDYSASQGVPLAGVLVPLSGIMSIVAGLSIILGYKTRIGAVVAIVFLIPVTLVFHHFWTLADPGAREMQMIHFMKNISMLGGAFIILVNGAGAYSLDARGRTHS